MSVDAGLLLDFWLKNNGFRKNPFLSTESESDADLEEYFVEPESFSEIVGNACDPKSAVLFAPRGGGKTANRVIVDRWCRTGNKTGGNVFCVVYTNFDNLLGKVGTVDGVHYAVQLDVHDHTREIMKSALGNLLDLWLANPRLILKTADAPFNVQSYVNYWLKQYHERLEPRRIQQLYAIIQELPTANIGVEKFPATPTQDLDALVTLVRMMGIDAVYILVDRVDEFNPATIDPTIGAFFLAPLIGHMSLMEHAGLAFKFFLPTEMSQALIGNKILRPERLVVREVIWSNAKLAEILHARLETFSDGKIPTLDAVSVPELRGEIDQALVQAAQGSPRNLVLLGALLFEEHARSKSTNDLLITRAELEATILKFNAPKKKEPEPAQPPMGFRTATAKRQTVDGE